MMKEFSIMIHSLQDVQKFVAVTMAKPYEIQVGNDWADIDGKDFMGLFSLDYRYPQQVRANCSEEEFELLRREVGSCVMG